MEVIDLPDSVPTTTGELASPREALGELLRQLVRDLMKRELELMEVHEAAEFSLSVRKIATELSAAAATWARLSDSMREKWHV